MVKDSLLNQVAQIWTLCRQKDTAEMFEPPLARGKLFFSWPWPLILKEGVTNQKAPFKCRV